MITDSYGRPIESLRVSVTQRCNLNCLYCHREGEYPNDHVEMTPEEIQKIVRIVSSFGVTKVKLTGGEPLLRNDITSIVHGIREINEIEEISMTTNGILLQKLAKHLKEDGLSRVNISLDTLNPKTFKTITGVDSLEHVILGIKEAVKAGLNPVKINMVPLQAINDSEIPNMMRFARENDLILQLIELHTSEEDEKYRRYRVAIDDIEASMEKEAVKIDVRSMHHRKVYTMSDGTKVEIVKPMHNTEFCRYCNRLRVTSDGRLKPCLFRTDNLVNFMEAMREGASEESLKNLFLLAVRQRRPYFA